MAWGSQGMVFLGEDLLHSRDYSEDTARVVDAEVSRILREQEERAIELLSRHRGGLEAVAHGLLERETLDGEEVGRLVDEAFGRPVHESDFVRRLATGEQSSDRPTPGAARRETGTGPGDRAGAAGAPGTVGADGVGGDGIGGDGGGRPGASGGPGSRPH